MNEIFLASNRASIVLSFCRQSLNVEIKTHEDIFLNFLVLITLAPVSSSVGDRLSVHGSIFLVDGIKCKYFVHMNIRYRLRYFTTASNVMTVQNAALNFCIVYSDSNVTEGKVSLSKK
jgi:hypothetical protein